MSAHARTRPFIGLAAVLVAVLLATVAPPASAAEAGVDVPQFREREHGAAWPDADEAVAGTLLVTTSAPTATWLDARSATLSAAGVQRTDRVTSRVALMHVAAGNEAAAAATLRRIPGVVAVEPNRIREWSAFPNDPLLNEQWAHGITGVADAWDITTGSNAVLVAVADSGVVASHPDLAGRIVEQVDAGTGSVVAGSVDNDVCQVGHGTWVAGVIGAAGNNGVGVSGVNWNVAMLDINTADPNVTCGGPADVATIAAIDYARQAGADIVNLSLGAGAPGGCPVALQSAIDAARAAQVLVVASSGNSGSADNTPGAPASCNGTISVAAVGPTGNVAGYSTFNEYVDIAAPGGSSAGGSAEDVLTTSFWEGGTRTGDYHSVAGTSFASPYIAGVAALMRAVNPTIGIDQLEAALESTSFDAGPPGRDADYGWGIIQAGAALQAVATGNIPPLQPDPDFPVEGGGPPPGGGDFIRISAGGGTEAVSQAVAMSQFAFGDLDAQLAVLARRDDFADGLAGSAVTFGLGPVLFTDRQGPLAQATRDELLRVLPAGSPVFLMGGTAALPDTLEDELEGLGYEPVRLAGPGREETAAAAAPVVVQIAAQSGFSSGSVILATRGDWPDAVGAGQLGAFFGMPILLTPHNLLHPATRDELIAQAPQRIYVVGGTGVVSDAVANEAGAATGAEVIRLAGPTRTGTGVAVADAFVGLLIDSGFSPSNLTVFANFRRADGFAHVLSAAPFAGATATPLLPLEGESGMLTDDVVGFVCGAQTTAVIAGGTDIVTDDVAGQVGAALAGDC